MSSMLFIAMFMTVFTQLVTANWEDWWTYDGISGPAYWGLINPAWTMCNKGRRQSPVNIDPTYLTYDSSLTTLNIDKEPVSGKLTNTGQTLVFRVDSEGQIPVNITGGPLAYRFQFQEIYFHWGQEIDSPGSEHTINHHSFPAEIQLYGFNSQLYTNLSVAKKFPGGVVGVSVMVQLRSADHRLSQSERQDHRQSGLGLVVSKLGQVKYRGHTARVHQLSMSSLLPSTTDYVTYEGSTTFPGCWETATWIVLNKPIYLTKHELERFLELKQGDKVMEKAPLGNNLRPRQPINNRSLRTNIGLNKDKTTTECQKNIARLEYTANNWISTSSPEYGFTPQI